MENTIKNSEINIKRLTIKVAPKVELTFIIFDTCSE